MASARRIEKLQTLLREELAALLKREFDFPDQTMLTVTQVRISPDARYATAMLSVLGGNTAHIITQLEKEIWHIQRLLNRRLRMRPVPQIRFAVDEGETRRENIERALATLKNEGKL